MTAQGNRAILLVEDNPMDVDLTLRAFRRHNIRHPVQVARDGDEVLSWIPRWLAGEPLPLLILLDLKLPRVSGLEVLRQLKAEPPIRVVPVVILTTSERESDMRTAYELGANSYIRKPVEFDRFLETAAQINLYWTSLNQTPA